MAAVIPLKINAGEIQQFGPTDTLILANGSTATTQSANDNSTKVATTAFVMAQQSVILLDYTVTPQTPLTGTTNETKQYSFAIPANTLLVGDLIEFIVRETKTGVVGLCTHRTRFGVANDLTGTRIATVQNIAAVTAIQWERRFIFVQDSTTLSFFDGTVSSGTDMTSGTYQTLTINRSVINYLVFSDQLASAADSVTFAAYFLRIYRKPV